MLERTLEIDRRQSVQGLRPLPALRPRTRRLRRLLGMSPGEIAYRTLERLRVAADRQRCLRAGPPCTTVPLPARGGSFLAYLREDLNCRFFFNPSPSHRRQLRARLADQEAPRLAHAREEAEELLAHRVELLGIGAVDIADAIDWHLDPIAQARWPLRFWADYDLVNGDGPDPKVIHELARHGHIPRLAAAYYWFDDERYAREVVAEILAFIEQNPVGWGVHWCSSLELALRAIAWITSLPLIARATALDEGTARRIGEALMTQLAHVHAYPSLYSSPNTHLIGEATALFLGGCFLPDAPAAAAYRRAGARYLEREIRRQVGADGVHKELSTYYHAYALDFFLLAAVMGERCAVPFSAGYGQRLARMAEFLSAVATSDGRVPALGDDDGGCAFTLGGRHYHDVRGLLSSAALWLDRPDLYRSTGSDHALWLYGPERVSEFEARLTPPVPHPDVGRVRTQDFAEAGYAVQTMTARGREARLIFDTGPMGMDAGGHAHADALSLLMTVDDRPLLVDPGTFVYNRAPEWRAYFRGTRAHNTVSVDGVDQTEPAGTFAWGRKARVTVGEPLDRPWCAYRWGEHDGYRRLAGDVRHRRHLLAIGLDHWLIVDELIGRGNHRCVWHYHMAPEAAVDVTSSNGVVRVGISVSGTEAGLTVATSETAVAELVAGGLAPIQGWVSPRYARRRPAPALEVAVAGTLPLVAVTLLRPWRSPVPLEVERRHGALVARAAAPFGSEVMIVNRHGRTAATAEGCVDRGVLWLRTEHGAVTHWLAAGSGRFRAGDLRLDMGRDGVMTGHGYGPDRSGGA
jgi:hypothetical protein